MAMCSATQPCLLNGKPIALLFGPDKRLVPVNPGFAQFNSAPLILDGVSPSAKTIICLKNNRAEPPYLRSRAAVMPANAPPTTTSHCVDI